MRQIILDTETTGLNPKEGHRIIEVGCVEMVNRKLTGNHFHEYINPQREIEADAIAVHGITNEFLEDKPNFAEVAKPLLAFIQGAELVIHNAPFDVGFLNHEYKMSNRHWRGIESVCTVFDTLVYARKKHLGQRNSLDALCKRYGVDNSNRELHGALLDAEILALVYLMMTGGQADLFKASEQKSNQVNIVHEKLNRDAHTKIIKANADELKAHEQQLKYMNKQGQCLWSDK